MQCSNTYYVTSSQPSPSSNCVTRITFCRHTITYTMVATQTPSKPTTPPSPCPTMPTTTAYHHGLPRPPPHPLPHRACLTIVNWPCVRGEPVKTLGIEPILRPRTERLSLFPLIGRLINWFVITAGVNNLPLPLQAVAVITRWLRSYV